VYRVLVWPSPGWAGAWRNVVYRVMGAEMHATARIDATARVWLPANLTMREGSRVEGLADIYNVVRITIGAQSRVGKYSFLCAASHDFENPTQPLTTAPITLGDGVMLGEDVFVAPGVTIAENVVVGARSSVLTSDLPARHVCAGSPARVVRSIRLGDNVEGAEGLQRRMGVLGDG